MHLGAEADCHNAEPKRSTKIVALGQPRAFVYFPGRQCVSRLQDAACGPALMDRLVAFGRTSVVGLDPPAI